MVGPQLIRHLPLRLTVGSSLMMELPTARDEFEYGPGSLRNYRKSTLEEQGQKLVEHTYYVGDFA